MSHRLCALRRDGRWINVILQTDVMDVTPTGAFLVQREPGARHAVLQVLVPLWLGDLVCRYLLWRYHR